MCKLKCCFGHTCCAFCGEMSKHGLLVSSLPHVVSDVEMLKILRNGAYTIVDARPHSFYEKKHHPGALNISALEEQPLSSDAAVQRAIDEGRLQTTNKNAIFLCHCDSGYFAASSRGALERAGYTRALNAKSFAHVGRMLVRAATQGDAPEATNTYVDAAAPPSTENMSRDDDTKSHNNNNNNADNE